MLRSPGPGGLDSLLTVVETNHFKQLTHVSLRLRPGHDAAVKQVGCQLAFGFEHLRPLFASHLVALPTAPGGARVGPQG